MICILPFPAFFFFCQNDWISNRWISAHGQRCGKFPHLFILWDCVLGKSLLVPGGADLLIQVFLGKFLIPLWPKLHVCGNTNKHFKALQHSKCMSCFHIVSGLVPVPQLAVLKEKHWNRDCAGLLLIVFSRRGPCVVLVYLGKWEMWCNLCVCGKQY